jgi:anti-sigma regulatory factor (Ser/Thr protein kinase)
LLHRDCYLIRNTPAAPALARRYVDEALSDSPRAVVDAIALMVSELATNCVRYVSSDFTVSIERTANEVRVDVADDDAGRVEMRRPGPDELTGRGLRIVDELSDSWGVSNAADGGGKSVWFTLQLPSASEQAH